MPIPRKKHLLPLFDKLYADLEAPVARRFFGRRTNSEAVRGLYIWGGVGSGKSMLMDLFSEVVEVPKRRVHFHAFMQEIHSEMHEVRKTGVDDAIAPVAEKVISDVRYSGL